jgi:pyrroline-5-carboxylate reductase
MKVIKKTSKYAFIGAGNMGQALIQGARESGIPGVNINISDPSITVRAQCASLYKVNTFSDNREACKNADIVVLSVKPKEISGVLESISPTKKENILYISVAAGVTLQQLRESSGENSAIIRCMPNTPAIVRSGITALIANENVTKPQCIDAENLLGAVGNTVWIENESLMDAITAVSGSGPAYFFMLIELLEKTAIELGLPSALANDLAVQTAYGSCKLARNSSETPKKLRENVTSPNGTTEAALNVFAKENIELTVKLAVTAARDRSIELAKGS